MFDELAANRQSMESWPEFFRDRDALVWMLDVSDPDRYTESLDVLRRTLRGAKGSIGLEKSVLVVLVLNKIDIWDRRKEDPDVIERDIINSLRAPKRYTVCTTRLSALDLVGCKNFLDCLSGDIAEHKDLLVVRLARKILA